MKATENTQDEAEVAVVAPVLAGVDQQVPTVLDVRLLAGKAVLPAGMTMRWMNFYGRDLHP